MSIEETLAERGKRYGDFRSHARIAQSLKYILRQEGLWTDLSDDKQQALEVICDKMARIVNGDPEYHDNWHDIVGYAKLVADTLEH
jgi:hypothetical protein